MPPGCRRAFSRSGVTSSSAALSPGESLLVHGGGGGIGTTAIQIAAAFGNRVFTTAAGPEQCAALEQLGATRAIDFTREDFRGGPQGGDRRQGGERHPRYRRRRLCGPRHRLSRPRRPVGDRLSEGSKVEIDLMPVMLKRLTITGSTLRIQSVQRKARSPPPCVSASGR